MKKEPQYMKSGFYRKLEVLVAFHCGLLHSCGGFFYINSCCCEDQFYFFFNCLVGFGFGECVCVGTGGSFSALGTQRAVCVTGEGICCNKCYLFHPDLQVPASFKSLPSHCISLQRLGSLANNS